MVEHPIFTSRRIDPFLSHDEKRERVRELKMAGIYYPEMLDYADGNDYWTIMLMEDLNPNYAIDEAKSIVRELEKDMVSPGYIQEKMRKIARSLHDFTYRKHPSEGEYWDEVTDMLWR